MVVVSQLVKNYLRIILEIRDVRVLLYILRSNLINFLFFLLLLNIVSVVSILVYLIQSIEKFFILQIKFLNIFCKLATLKTKKDYLQKVI